MSVCVCLLCLCAWMSGVLYLNWLRDKRNVPFSRKRQYRTRWGKLCDVHTILFFFKIPTLFNRFNIYWIIYTHLNPFWSGWWMWTNFSHVNNLEMGTKSLKKKTNALETYYIISYLKLRSIYDFIFIGTWDWRICLCATKTSNQIHKHKHTHTLNEFTVKRLFFLILFHHIIAFSLYHRRLR